MNLGGEGGAMAMAMATATGMTGLLCVAVSFSVRARGLYIPRPSLDLIVNANT